MRIRLFLVAGLAVIVTCIIGAAQRSSSAAVRPLVSIQGADGRISEPRFVRVRDRESFDKLWAEHRGLGEGRWDSTWSGAPEIDFERCEVVAYFRGKATNTRGEHVEAIVDEGNVRRIRFDSSSYQTASMLKEGEKVHQGLPPQIVSYGIWIIDRTEREIVLEENTQGLKNSPAKWTERHRFPAAPAK